MSDGWITLMSFSQPMEAHIAKSKLESEGIDCALADENIVRVDWLWSNAVGGVKLKVHESQYEEAAQILAEISAAAKPAVDTGVACPNCKSGDMYLEPKHRKGTLFWAAIFGLPLPFIKKVWTCRACDSTFPKESISQKA